MACAASAVSPRQGVPIRSSSRGVDPPQRAPAFKWVNTALGNIKAAITGSSKHAPRCLAEFADRFYRRYHLAAMIPRLTRAGVRTPPMPYPLLKMAEGQA
jgi:hypothetical protein